MLSLVVLFVGVLLFSLTALKRPMISWLFVAYLAIVLPVAFAMWLLILRNRWRQAARRNPPSTFARKQSGNSDC